jgi:hypothetical protein
MAKYDQTGIPSIVTAKSASAAQTTFADVVTPQPLAESLASLVRAALDKFTDAAVIVIDPSSRKVTAATGAQGVAIKVAAGGACGNPATIFADEGQTGRSLTYNYEDKNQIEASQATALEAACDAAKPRRTVEGLVSALLNSEFTAEPPCIIVDQTNGQITVLNPTSGTSVGTAVNAVIVAGDQIQMALTEPETTGTASALPFEGGAV